MIMGSPEIQPTPEAQEKERYYIVIEKKTGETEIKPVSLLEFNPKSQSQSQEEKDMQAIVRPDGVKLHSFTERARNELGLDPSEYVLSGPYESEESAKIELEEFGADAIPKLIAKEERDYSVEDEEEKESEELERAAN